MQILFVHNFVITYSVPYLKFQRPVPLISIALLSTQCRFHSFLDDPNLIGGCLNQVGSNGEGLVDVLPAKQGPTLPSIQYFIWGHPYTGIINVVIGEFDKHQLLIPNPLKVQGTGS